MDTASRLPIPIRANQFNIDLKFKNWYLRWLGLFIQFYDSKGIVDASLLPPDISKFLGYIGYGWESYNTQGCVSGAGQFDQLANIANANGPGGNAQTGYAASPCGLQGAAKLVYDPLGRPDVNFYLDTTNNLNMLRQVQLNPPKITDPRAQQS
jgi:hypothetical protein